MEEVVRSKRRKLKLKNSKEFIAGPRMGWIDMSIVLKCKWELV
jgi:hypothetical protein